MGSSKYFTKSARAKIVGFRVNPSIHHDKVSDKARNGAFKDGVIADNNALGGDVDFVSLICH